MSINLKNIILKPLNGYRVWLLVGTTRSKSLHRFPLEVNKGNRSEPLLSVRKKKNKSIKTSGEWRPRRQWGSPLLNKETWGIAINFSLVASLNNTRGGVVAYSSQVDLLIYVRSQGRVTYSCDNWTNVIHSKD